MEQWKLGDTLNVSNPQEPLAKSHTGNSNKNIEPTLLRCLFKRYPRTAETRSENVVYYAA
jgi:hypothetical protein